MQLEFELEFELQERMACQLWPCVYVLSADSNASAEAVRRYLVGKGRILAHSPLEPVVVCD